MELTEFFLLFNEATQAMGCGEYADAIQMYERLLHTIPELPSEMPPAQLNHNAWSVAFNFAQTLCKTGEFCRSLQWVEDGLQRNPDPFDRAVALAVRGEALCGIGREKEGLVAFKESVLADPVVGRLNSADAMTRVGSAGLLNLALQWTGEAERVLSQRMNIHYFCEICAIRGKVAMRRGDFDAAREQFERALSEHPGYDDIKLHLRLLSARTDQ